MRGTALAIVVAVGIAPPTVHAQTQDVAKQLQNPLADLASIPIQNDWDTRLGPREEGTQYTFSLQPVAPVNLNADWIVISRTILPFISQDAQVAPTTGPVSGLGDVTQSFFFSPRRNSGGLTWGAGPVFLVPTATDDALGSKKWGLGPTGAAVRVEGAWTYGFLANHIWSVAGNSDHAEVSRTFVQPFVAHTDTNGFTLAANFEATYDWKSHAATVPLNLIASQLINVGAQPLNLTGGIRYFFNAPNDGPDWGIRVALTLVFR